MRLNQFIKWWWKKNDEFNRTVACFILFCAIPCAIASTFVGKMAIAGLLIGLCITVGGWALYGIFYWLREMWREFDDEVPAEDIALMRKLRGIPTPSVPKPEYYD
jgi:hypothetical protein